MTSGLPSLIFSDLSTSFDTIDHSILLSVLQHYFGTPLLWFQSYLSDCTQSFFVNSTTSTPQPVSCSVPPGSLAGLNEFIAYTEDVSLLYEQHNVRHLYADDMQAYMKMSVSDVDHARTVLLLQLNGNKTELIWFGSKATLVKLSKNKLDLEVGGDIIHPVSSVRNLGILFDFELLISNHVSRVNFDVCDRSDCSSGMRSLHSWCLHLFCHVSITATPLWQIFHYLLLSHFSEYSMPLHDL